MVAALELVVYSKFWRDDSSAVYVGLLHVKSYRDQTPSLWCGAEVWRRGASSSVSSSGRGSKQSPFKNIPRVPSKRDVNITKLNHTNFKAYRRAQI
ncbi:hypothetical protein AVEN_180383-1 [Araneus ventricosus]|uniref:Uncharacterized protein n=1 Tax=Araneus ventricosus TaxID=182803 RepID=A0A4Y2P7Q8_ARAVE|nr:hypothetical protein AVEN_180383-1 [Araneus ventricosus]